MDWDTFKKIMYKRKCVQELNNPGTPNEVITTWKGNIYCKWDVGYPYFQNPIKWLVDNNKPVTIVAGIRDRTIVGYKQPPHRKGTVQGKLF